MTLIDPRSDRPLAPKPEYETGHETVEPVQTQPRAIQPNPTLPEADTQAEAREALAQALSGRFEVLQPIAIGGMATLFQLRHRRTAGLFAAKVMHPNFVQHPGFLQAFTREAQVGALLAGHPNAVPILDLDQAGALPFLLMPYVEGRDLDHVLAEHGRFPRDEALMLLAQLTSLLMYAEREGLIHADIALGNIRLDRFGQYRLLDYGLAHAVGQSLEDFPFIAGTPASNSPEQIRGESLDIRSDLYSLGLVFFHALTGAPAFDLQALTDLDALAEAHLQGRWTLPEPFSNDLPLATLLRKLLATDRERRIASAFELGGALAALGFELPSFARALPGIVPALPRIRRRRLEALQPVSLQP